MVSKSSTGFHIVKANGVFKKVLCFKNSVDGFAPSGNGDTHFFMIAMAFTTVMTESVITTNAQGQSQEENTLAIQKGLFPLLRVKKLMFIP